MIGGEEVVVEVDGLVGWNGMWSVLKIGIVEE